MNETIHISELVYEQITTEHPSWINAAIVKLDEEKELTPKQFSSNAGILVHPPTPNLDTSHYVYWSRRY